jgi:hypothetical protein
MSLLGNSLSLRDVYVKTSIDEGQFFDNMPLEKRMTDFLGQSKTLTKKPFRRCDKEADVRAD